VLHHVISPFVCGLDREVSAGYYQLGNVRPSFL
jgi:hypothetical protein